ncbi:MAG TPA: WhiB family transcriptional regulator [Acidimicrobiales bacterium]|nr:WhiB family transcriptional regulator [Acidimicrobiales bacterium]
MRWAWMDRAACRGMADTVFFPEGPHRNYSRARRICAGCPVRKECLRYALEGCIGFGMFGGLTPRQRAALRRRRRREEVA